MVAAEDEHVTVAIAHPTDRLAQSVPQELWKLSSGARRIFDNARTESWPSLSADVDRVKAAWTELRTRNVPPLLARPRIGRAITDLQGRGPSGT